MSHAAPRQVSSEIVLTVRIAPTVLAETIRRLPQIVTTVPIAVVPDADGSPTPQPEDPAPAPRPDRTSDPPATPPALHPHLVAKGYYLSPKPCPQRHRYLETAYCLRRHSKHGCVACNEHWAYQRGHRPRPNGQARPTGSLERLALPGHLLETCFLSPIRCEIAAHHWRDTAYTLRFLADEVCVQCVTQRHGLAGTPLALADD